jgi:putative transcriptional regulator
MRARWILAAAGAVACAVAAAGAALGPPAPGAVAALPPWPSAFPRDLAKGKFLIASPQAGGPYFYESVVLLLDYEPGGAVGLIVNRPTEIELAQLLPDVEALRGRSDRAFFGGPVERQRMMVLYRSSEPPPDSRPIAGEIHASGSFETLRKVVESGATASRFRAYVGYAGWGMGQLAGEVARGDWLIAPAEASAVFEMDPEKVWREFIERSSGLQADRRPKGDVGIAEAISSPVDDCRGLEATFRVSMPRVWEFTARARTRATPPPGPAHRRPRAAGR